jgi:hypothetical protein
LCKSEKPGSQFSVDGDARHLDSDCQ